jgi:hypothetical protein
VPGQDANRPLAELGALGFAERGQDAWLGGVIATGDPDDLRSLSREHTNIKVQALSLP